MIWTIIVVLLILWLLGFFGASMHPRIPRFGSWIHTLVVVAIILIILKLIGVA